MTVPVRLEDVTAAWLDETLHGCGLLGSERVVGVELDPIGTFSSQLVRVRLRYDETRPRGDAARGLPVRLVLKRSPGGGRERVGEHFANEIRFYRELARRVPARLARFHHGEVDPETGSGFLLLEDVPGVAATDWLHGPDEAHARLAVTSMARLHAAFWQAVDDLDWVPHFADPELLASFEEAYARGWSAWRGFFSDAVPGFAPLGDALVGRVVSSHARLGDEATLLHGDAHAENMPLTGSHEAAGGREIVMLDWAALRRGNAGVDLGFFLPMSFPAERRGAVERSLVALHGSVLEQHGARPGSDPWLGYRRGVLRRVARIVGSAETWDPGAVSALRMIFQRCATAAVELRVDELV